MSSRFSPQNNRDSFAESLASVTLLIKGELPNSGGRYWAYVAMKPSMIPELNNQRNHGMFDLEEFGTILEWGKAENPPPETIQQMYRTYGLAQDSEQRISALLKEA